MMSNKQTVVSSLAELEHVSEETAKSILANASIKFPLREEGSHTLNPMQMGDPDELAQLFSSMAGVELTDDQRETTARIIKKLPEGATVKDFIDACDACLAQDLASQRSSLRGFARCSRL